MEDMCQTASLHCEVLALFHFPCSRRAQLTPSLFQFKVKVCRPLVQRLGVSMVILYGGLGQGEVEVVRWVYKPGGFDLAIADAAPVLSSTARWKKIPEPTMDAWICRGQRAEG